MIGEQVQHYRILRQLGEGGMGVVYEAEDTRLGRHVALKFLPDSLRVAPDALERFEREARIASSLNHPNICTIYDIGEDAAHGGRRFIVMELLDGESLRTRIHGQPMSADLVLETGYQIADALDAAHAKGVIHRDIKPANIFITRRGQAKLLDFGIAKLGTERHASAAGDETRQAGDALTSPGTAVGSINYMSPEQARGEDLDGRTDLFSLGVVLYEMATGRQAFAGQTTAVVFDAILNKQPPEPRLANPDLPEELARVIHRSLEKDRRMRFQTAADMLAELSRIRRDTTGRTAASLPVTAPSATAEAPLPAARVEPSRRWWRVAVPAVIVFAGLGYYIWNASKVPAFTERDTVVVSDFSNSTGDAVFDDALKQALSVQLQQTPYLTLLPDLRVQRTLKLMQRQPDQPITPQVARELCQRVGAKATVEGSIASLGTNYVITIGVHNCQTGEALAEQQVQAGTKEDVLNKLGEATTTLRKRLGESLASVQKYDVPVTEATTSSLEALKAYGLANKTRYTRGDEAAIPFFQKAIEIDPNFALAYAKLAVVYSNTGREDDSRKYAQKAYEMKDRVSEYERLYITWNYDTKVLQDQKLSRETLELMIASYPRDYAAQNNLGVYYTSRGEFDESAKHYRAATELAPDEPLPMANLAYALFFLDQRQEAYSWVEKSLAIRPDGSLALRRWLAAVRAGDPDAAKFEEAARKIAQPDDMLGVEGVWAAWQGRLKENQRIYEQLIARARAAHDDGRVSTLEAAHQILLAVYQGGTAVEALKASTAKTASPEAQAQAAAVLATFGQLDVARPVAARLEPLGKQNVAVWVPVAVIKAYARAASGQWREAVADLETTLNEYPRGFDVNFHIASIREAAGDVEGAEASYRGVIRAVAFLGFDSIETVAHLRLGELLAKKGDATGAKEQFDILLKQWEKADTEFTLLKRVREERRKLGS
ncbi:MAG TPA: protein kinase [Vicinamibacterales bacterium]|nr:protein kinase [Vicinamibacterales bacterium]